MLCFVASMLLFSSQHSELVDNKALTQQTIQVPEKSTGSKTVAALVSDCLFCLAIGKQENTCKLPVLLESLAHFHEALSEEANDNKENVISEAPHENFWGSFRTCAFCKPLRWRLRSLQSAGGLPAKLQQRSCHRPQ